MTFLFSYKVRRMQLNWVLELNINITTDQVVCAVIFHLVYSLTIYVQKWLHCAASGHQVQFLVWIRLTSALLTNHTAFHHFLDVVFFAYVEWVPWITMALHIFLPPSSPHIPSLCQYADVSEVCWFKFPWFPCLGNQCTNQDTSSFSCLELWPANRILHSLIFF